MRLFTSVGNEKEHGQRDVWEKLFSDGRDQKRRIPARKHVKKWRSAEKKKGYGHLPRLRLVQALVRDVHDLLQDLADVLFSGLDRLIRALCGGAVDRAHAAVSGGVLGRLALVSTHQTHT